MDVGGECYELLEQLMSEHTHSDDTHFDLVLLFCGASAIAALSRCNRRMHNATARQLAHLKQAQADELCALFGFSSMEEMAAKSTLTVGNGLLTNAQWRHLGVLLLEGGALGRVKRIHLTDNRAGELLCLLELRDVCLSGKKLRLKGGSFVTLAVCMIEAQTTNLTELNIEFDFDDANGLKSLLQTIAAGTLTKLTQLDLSEKKIGAGGMNAISMVISRGMLPNLRQLWLRGNNIRDEGIYHFSRAIESGALQHLKLLDLGNNEIRDDGARKISNAIATGALPALTNFSIDQNPIHLECKSLLGWPSAAKK